MKLHNISIEFLSCRESMTLYNEPPESGYLTNKISPYFSIYQSLCTDLIISKNDEEILIKQNQCVLMPANAHQKMSFTEDKIYPCANHAQYVFMDIVINGKYRIDDLFDFPLVLPEEYQTEMFILLQELSRIEDIEENLCDRLSIAYKIIKILLLCSIPKKKLAASMLLAIDYVKRNYRRNISISELAEVAKMSESNFFRIFKRSMGTSPVAYINDYRLLISSVLLETTDKKIGSISEEVGFNEQYYFSKLFSKRFGVSPAVYRKNYRHS